MYTTPPVVGPGGPRVCVCVCVCGGGGRLTQLTIYCDRCVFLDLGLVITCNRKSIKGQLTVVSYRDFPSKSRSKLPANRSGCLNISRKFNAPVHLVELRAWQCWTMLASGLSQQLRIDHQWQASCRS